MGHIKTRFQLNASFGPQVFSQFFAIDALNISVYRRPCGQTSDLGSRVLNTSIFESHQNCRHF
jgi:hypothetical protein